MYSNKKEMENSLQRSEEENLTKTGAGVGEEFVGQESSPERKGGRGENTQLNW